MLNSLSELFEICYYHAKGVLKWGWRKPLVSYQNALLNFFRYDNSQYERRTFSELKERRTCDTLFVLASGPSLGELSETDVEIVNGCDSFGFNFSFLYDKIVPTYYIMSFERQAWMSDFYLETFSKFRSIYSNTNVIILDKALSLCLLHPRLTPLHLPQCPNFSIVKIPNAINLESCRPFAFSDFERTLFYRGTLTLVLHYAVALGYKNIVLIGVDPHTRKHFYSGFPSMQKVEEQSSKAYSSGDPKLFEYMIPKGNKFHPMDVYLKSLEEYLRVERGTQLFIGKSDNPLSCFLPSYFS
jgi:hypothetical protein